jgi:hypothetical protein
MSVGAGVQATVFGEALLAAGGMSMYRYVEGNPPSCVDPMGLASLTIGPFEGVSAQFTLATIRIVNAPRITQNSVAIALHHT